MELTNQQRASLSVITAAVASFHAVTELHVETYHEPTGVRKNPEEATLGEDWLKSCMANNQKLFDDTRLRRDVWDSLLGYLTSRGWLEDSKQRNSKLKCLTAGEKLLIFCYICGQGSSYRNARSRSGHSLETISR